MEIEGHCDPRFAAVGDAFREGFVAGRDVGAAVAVTLEGELVVDLQGGHRDRKRRLPWQQDTLVCLFSVSKLVTALCALQAVERGRIDLDSPVVEYWPEFAGAAKADITLRHLLSHQAGLVGFHTPVSSDLYYRWEPMVHALESETPWWVPGTAHGYHARTFGFLVGECLRRTTGLLPGEWLQREISTPLQLDFHIGLATGDLARCAEMLPARIRAGEQKQWPPAMREMMRDFTDPATPTGAAFQNPALKPGYMNTPEFRQAQIPAVNGHGTARSLARLMGNLDRVIGPELLAEAIRTHSVGPDRVLKSVTQFGLGFMLHHPEAPIGIRPGSFGHAGAGGSMAFCDPAARIGFCYGMNQMQEGVVTGGTSAMNVAETVYRCL